MNSSFTRDARRIFGGIALSTLTYGMPAHGQQQTAEQAVELEELVVTGSRLRDANVLSASPITTISAEQMSQSGAVSLESALQALPDIRTQGSSGTSTQGLRGDQGFIDLHHLGYARTLALIDGRRATPSMAASGVNTISASVSSIPFGMIERVEVLKDGASPVYGSDAIGGVVNVILKDSFDGFGVFGQTGSTTVGDRTTGRGAFLVGKAFDRSNIMLGFDMSRRDFARYDERMQYATTPDTIGVLANGEIGVTSSGTTATPGGVVQVGAASGSRYAFTAPGVYEPYDPAEHNAGLFPWQTIAPRIDSISAMPKGSFAINDNLTLRVEGFYSEQKVEGTGPIGGPPRALPANAPGNPFGVPVTTTRIIFPEDQPRTITTDLQTWRGVVGLEGDVLNDRFRWQLDYVWGRTREHGALENNYDLNAFAIATNSARCATTPGCVPLDLFGPDTITPEAWDYVKLTSLQDTGYDQRIVAGSVDGSLFDLPAGPVNAALGFEYRTDEGFARYYTDVPGGIPGSGGGGESLAGKYKTKEAFVELNVPVIQDVPLIQSLTLNTAARHSRFDFFGNATTWKAGALWSVNDSLRFRGNRSTGFRAPNLGEAFSGRTNAATQGANQDPCLNAASNPLYAAGCAAAGVPANYVPPTNQILLAYSGNPNLEPEKSQNTSIGVVLTPTFLDGFSMSVDYYRVHMDDVILSLDPIYITQQCYASGAALSHPYCAYIGERNPDGTLPRILVPYDNVGRMNTDGLDAVLDYRARLSDFGLNDPGELSLHFEGNYILEFQLQRQRNAPFTKFDGITYIDGNFVSMPKFRGTMRLQYSRSHWLVGWSARAIGPSRANPTLVQQLTVPSPWERVPWVFYQDLYAQTEIDSAVGPVKFGLNVQNVFDKKAPLSYPGIGYAYGLYDLLGRSAYLTVSFGF